MLFYIHGGGFYSGSGSTELLGPDFLLMADVVVVTINYRLGALGFLNLKDKELNVPGNAGLKDQLLAMKFVKSNIRNFGGDPNNIVDMNSVTSSQNRNLKLLFHRRYSAKVQEEVPSVGIVSQRDQKDYFKRQSLWQVVY